MNRPLNFVVLGDSVIWGQGLREEDKIYTLVAASIAASVGVPVNTFVAAHSGATILVADKDNEIKPGELPYSHPSITAQVSIAASKVQSAGFTRNDVDLVLTNGGINDVDVRNMLSVDPTVGPDWVRKLTRERALSRLPGLLAYAGGPDGFPNATIVVMNYYPIISNDSDLGLVTAILTILFYGAGFITSLVLRAKLAAQCAAFNEEMNNAIQELVSASPKRLVAGFSGYASANAFGGPETLLFGLGKGIDPLAPTDPMADERAARCKEDHYLDSLKCIHASMGHPKETGARYWATRITAAIAPLVTGWKSFGSGIASAFVTQSVPEVMVTGQQYSASVVFKNTGGQAWSSAGNYHLGSQNPQDNMIWLQTSNRVPLPGDVAPGALVTFQFTVRAPSAPATYNWQWRMVQDGVQWFGDLTDSVAVTVESPECASIRADIQAHRDEIGTLTTERDTLAPGSIADRQRILAINRRIGTLTSEITRLRERAAALACRQNL